jgi:hypothetical protein
MDIEERLVGQTLKNPRTPDKAGGLSVRRSFGNVWFRAKPGPFPLYGPCFGPAAN